MIAVIGMMNMMMSVVVVGNNRKFFNIGSFDISHNFERFHGKYFYLDCISYLKL